MSSRTHKAHSAFRTCKSDCSHLVRWSIRNYLHPHSSFEPTINDASWPVPSAVVCRVLWTWVGIWIHYIQCARLHNYSWKLIWNQLFWRLMRGCFLCNIWNNIDNTPVVYIVLYTPTHYVISTHCSSVRVYEHAKKNGRRSPLPSSHKTPFVLDHFPFRLAVREHFWDTYIIFAKNCIVRHSSWRQWYSANNNTTRRWPLGRALRYFMYAGVAPIIARILSSRITNAHARTQFKPYVESFTMRSTDQCVMLSETVMQANCMWARSDQWMTSPWIQSRSVAYNVLTYVVV